MLLFFLLFFLRETLGGIGFRLALTFVVDVFVVELDSCLDVVAVLKIKTLGNQQQFELLIHHERLLRSLIPRNMVVV